MKRYTSKNKPPGINTFYKRTKTALFFDTEMFEIETDMGYTAVSSSTPGWDGGYFVAWPMSDDGRVVGKPWPVPPAYVARHYFAGPHEEDE